MLILYLINKKLEPSLFKLLENKTKHFVQKEILKCSFKRCFKRGFLHLIFCVGTARTQSPMLINSAPEFSSFVKIANVNQFVVQ